MVVDKFVRQVVRKAIIDWDPEGLIYGGAPLDEYDGEIDEILAAFPLCETEGDLVETLEDVFSASFARPFAGRCDTVAHEIMAQLYVG
ncbi:MAG: hypothetical protein ACYC5Y_12470 [Symbiobacteriia bacterium]